MSIITVTGANGHLGRLVVGSLLNKGVAPSDLRVSVRDVTKAADLRAQGIDVRHGDFDDFDSLQSAFSGSERLLIISTDRLGVRIEQHQRAVRAAKEMGVKHVVYTSLVKAVINPQTGEEAPLSVEHRATEKAIFESGMVYTILRNSFYAEYQLGPMVQALASGVYASSVGDTPLGCAARVDYAEAAAQALSRPGHENRIYELTMPRAWTFSEAARVVSKVSGKALEYKMVSDEELAGSMKAGGAPASAVEMTVGMNRLIRLGMLSLAAPDLEQILGRPVTTLEEVVRSIMRQGLG